MFGFKRTASAEPDAPSGLIVPMNVQVSVGAYSTSRTVDVPIRDAVSSGNIAGKAISDMVGDINAEVMHAFHQRRAALDEAIERLTRERDAMGV